MPGLDLDGLLRFAAKTAQEAARDVLGAAGPGTAVRLEQGRDIKLEADFRLEDAIVAAIRKKSAYPILSEERGLVAGTLGREPYRWIVDPLDGSLNFHRGIPLSCISIALWKGTEPVLGVILDVGRRELFTGLVGRGAWLNGEKIKVSDVRERSRAVLCTGFPISSDFSQEALRRFVANARSFKKVRMLGSAALMLAYVASGRADCYQEDSIRIWDVAAGLALVKAAGGGMRVTFSDDGLLLKVETSNRELLRRRP
jgi:myo-inositol-1(or 4)-monophosphatase